MLNTCTRRKAQAVEVASMVSGQVDISFRS